MTQRKAKAKTTYKNDEHLLLLLKSKVQSKATVFVSKFLLLNITTTEIDVDVAATNMKAVLHSHLY